MYGQGIGGELGYSAEIAAITGGCVDILLRYISNMSNREQQCFEPDLNRIDLKDENSSTYSPDTQGGSTMASKKVGTLIKEARTGANLTQEQLARKISGLSASDISLAERGQKDLTQAQLKQIAKITGVTQASLINAAKGSSSDKKSTTAKKSSSSSASKTSMKVTATEKKLVELYREADSETKKNVMKVLKGEDDDSDSLLENILETVQDLLDNK